MWKSGMRGFAIPKHLEIWNWGPGERVSESDLIFEKYGTGGYYTK
jgi:hypothetical protein